MSVRLNAQVRGAKKFCGCLGRIFYSVLRMDSVVKDETGKEIPRSLSTETYTSRG